MMLDKSIPYFNIIMRYDGPPQKEQPVLPEGFSFTSYREGDEFRWVEMEVANNDFDTYENGVKYFTAKYLTDMEKIKERFVGVVDSTKKLYGAVICWDDEKDGKKVSSVHWLITDPQVQGKGIGKALVQMLVKKFSDLNALPIYLHTQPWSYKAIGIYSSVGFRMLKHDSFRGYENQSKDALGVLKKLIPADKMNKIINEML